LTLLWIYKSLATRKSNIQQECKTVPQAARTSSISLIILKEQSLVNVILFHHSFGSCKLAFATSNNLIHFASIQPYVNDTFKVIPHWFHKQLFVIHAFVPGKVVPAVHCSYIVDTLQSGSIRSESPVESYHLRIQNLLIPVVGGCILNMQLQECYFQFYKTDEKAVNELKENETEELLSSYVYNKVLWLSASFKQVRRVTWQSYSSTSATIFGLNRKAAKLNKFNLYEFPHYLLPECGTALLLIIEDKQTAIMLKSNSALNNEYISAVRFFVVFFIVIPDVVPCAVCQCH
ncbi:hypothetical protein T07_12372, partial [Trichinella nelsoni]